MFQKKQKLNVANVDVSEGRKHRDTGRGIASPGMEKIQEMISAKATNRASYKPKGKSTSGPSSKVALKKKRGLNLNAGKLPVMGAM